MKRARGLTLISTAGQADAAAPARVQQRSAVILFADDKGDAVLAIPAPAPNGSAYLARAVAKAIAQLGDRHCLHKKFAQTKLRSGILDSWKVAQGRAVDVAIKGKK